MATPRRLCRLVTGFIRISAIFACILAAPAHAQANYSGPNSYKFGLPGSFYGGNYGGTTALEIGFKTNAGSNFLGCAGVGLFDYLQTTFNASNIIDQLKTNMQTMLAKTLLTTAMSVPQISAIFDTLNAFGNAKFDLFKQSCDMSSIRKDAKEMYMSRCTADGKNPATCDEEWGKGSSFANSDIMKSIQGLICQKENVNEGSVRGVACPSGGSCPIMAMLPQMRINLGGKGLNCGTKFYGSKDPMMSIQGMLNGVAGALTAPVLSKVDEAWRQFGGLTRSQKELAVREAVAKCSANATCGSSSGSAAAKSPVFLADKPLVTVRFAGDDPTSPSSESDLVKEFKTYMGCPEPEKSKGFMLFNQTMIEMSKYSESGGGSYTPSDMGEFFDTSSLDKNMSASLGALYANDMKSLVQMIDIAAKCTLNTVNFIDPSLRLELEKGEDGNADVLADLKSSTVIWSYLVTNAVGQFTINKANLVAAHLSNKSLSKSETVSSTAVATGEKEDNPGAEETSIAFDKGLEVLKDELRRMRETIETSEAWAKFRGNVLERNRAFR